MWEGSGWEGVATVHRRCGHVHSCIDESASPGRGPVQGAGTGTSGYKPRHRRRWRWARAHLIDHEGRRRGEAWRVAVRGARPIRTSALKVVLEPVTSSHVTSRQVTASHGKSRHITASHGKSRHITASHGKSRQVTAHHGMSRQVTASHGTSRHVTASHGNSSPVPRSSLSLELGLV